MGSAPMKHNENMYYRCRKEAARFNPDLTSRDSAADLLGVSPSSLADYELGITKIVPVDKVVLMADLYNAPQLMNCYCVEECPIGCRRATATEIRPLQMTVVSLLDLLSDSQLNHNIASLIHIAAGCARDGDAENMEEIISYLCKLRVLVDELMLYDEKRRGADGR